MMIPSPHSYASSTQQIKDLIPPSTRTLPRLSVLSLPASARDCCRIPAPLHAEVRGRDCSSRSAAYTSPHTPADRLCAATADRQLVLRTARRSPQQAPPRPGAASSRGQARGGNPRSQSRWGVMGPRPRPRRRCCPAGRQHPRRGRGRVAAPPGRRSYSSVRRACARW